MKGVYMLQPKLIRVTPKDNYRLLLVYETGEQKLFDVKPYITGEWYGELKDLNNFNSVRVANHTVEWNGGQDISPHELYEDSISIV